MANVIWQLPVKQSNVTGEYWIHTWAKYHAFVDGYSVCGGYWQVTDGFETNIEESGVSVGKEYCCNKCLEKLNQ